MQTLRATGGNTPGTHRESPHCGRGHRVRCAFWYLLSANSAERQSVYTVYPHGHTSIFRMRPFRCATRTALTLLKTHNLVSTGRSVFSMAHAPSALSHVHLWSPIQSSIRSTTSATVIRAARSSSDDSSGPKGRSKPSSGQARSSASSISPSWAMSTGRTGGAGSSGTCKGKKVVIRL
jgi:hypothetical protein